MEVSLHAAMCVSGLLWQLKVQLPWRGIGCLKAHPKGFDTRTRWLAFCELCDEG